MSWHICSIHNRLRHQSVSLQGAVTHLQSRSKESSFGLRGNNTESNYPERLELENTITFFLLLIRTNETTSGSLMLPKSWHFHFCIESLSTPLHSPLAREWGNTIS